MRGRRTLMACSVAALLCAASSSAGLAGSAGADGVIVVQGGTLFDGTGDDPVPGVSILVDGNRIEAVGKDLPVPAGAVIVDARGKTILPGLVDPHIHFRGWMPQFFLYFGVTSVFDTANPTEWILAQREAIAAGTFPGPRMFVTGLVIDGPSKPGARPHPAETGGYRIHVDTPEQAREWVRKLADLGVDGIKVHDGLTPPMLSALVDEARSRHLPVVGHSWNARDAVENGLRFIEHITPVARATMPADRLAEVGASEEIAQFMDEAQFGPLVELMVARRVVFNPTLLANWSRFGPLADRLAGANRAFLEQPFVTDAIRKQVRSRPDRESGAAEREAYRRTRRFVEQYVRAGGRLSAGSDTGTIPGLGLHQEMEMLVDFGYSPRQALLAATGEAAALMGQETDLGTVEPGKLADLLIVDGNPLVDITDTRKIHAVILDGRLLERRIDPTFVNPIPRPVEQ